MSYFLRLFIILLLFITTTSYAVQSVQSENENENENEKFEQIEAPLIKDPLSDDSSTEVGKHVMKNADAGSMILSLLMVLALIVISAFVLKRFNVIQQQQGDKLKVIASLSLGVKERLVVAQIGEQQLVLGVTSQQITLIKSLEEPIDSNNSEKRSALTGHLSKLLKKTNFNTKKI